MAKFVLVVTARAEGRLKDVAKQIVDAVERDFLTGVDDIYALNEDPDDDFDTVWYEVQKIGVKA